MIIKNILSQEVAQEVFDRINQLKPTDNPLWGKMSADQMLAHCNVAYTMTFEPETYSRPGFLKRFLMKLLIKKYVVGPKRFPKNSHTAPQFIIVGSKDFEAEKAKLIDNVRKCQQLGESYFEGKENFSFGKMTTQEWNTLFYKHLDHHLTQFGV